MRITVLAAVLLLAASKTKHPPKPTPAPTKNVHAELEARMAKVRATVVAIDKALPPTKVEKAVHGCGAKTGTLTAWLDGKRIVKLEARLFRDDGEMLRLFWFDAGGKLLFAKIERPQSTPEVEPDPAEKAERASPTEYFYEKGEIFRWTSGTSAPPPEEVTATADELSRGLASDESDVEC